MAKLIADIHHSYVNDKGRTVKGIVLGNQMKYPFKIWSQGCIRLASFLSRYGPKSASVLQAFIDDKPVAETDGLGYSTYENSDLIVLRLDRSDKQPLQFGASKAKLLVECLKNYSMGDILATLQDVIGEARPADSAPPRKGKSKGGQGKPKVDMDIEDVVEDAQVTTHQASNPDLDELSVQQQIDSLTGLIADCFKAIPQLQARLRELYAMQGVA